MSETSEATAPAAAIDAVAEVLHRDMCPRAVTTRPLTDCADIHRHQQQAAVILEAAATVITAAIRRHAQEHTFTLSRPNPGLGAGQQAMDVVPLTSLLEVL
jgi:hypothetical protein